MSLDFKDTSRCILITASNDRKEFAREFYTRPTVIFDFVEGIPRGLSDWCACKHLRIEVDFSLLRYAKAIVKELIRFVPPAVIEVTINDTDNLNAFAVALMDRQIISYDGLNFFKQEDGYVVTA